MDKQNQASHITSTTSLHIFLRTINYMLWVDSNITCNITAAVDRKTTLGLFITTHSTGKEPPHKTYKMYASLFCISTSPFKTKNAITLPRLQNAHPTRCIKTPTPPDIIHSLIFESNQSPITKIPTDPPIQHSKYKTAHSRIPKPTIPQHHFSHLSFPPPLPLSDLSSARNRNDNSLSRRA